MYTVGWSELLYNGSEPGTADEDEVDEVQSICDKTLMAFHSVLIVKWNVVPVQSLCRISCVC